jgi:DNA polymerase-3 subunit alpha
MGDSDSRPGDDAPDPGPAFVHLRVHSHYSLLSSPARIKSLVETAVADGQHALALTDSGNLFGAIEFYKACTAAKIKPILGMTAFLAGKSSLEKGGAAVNNPTCELTLLARNEEGFTNLRQLSTHGYLRGFYYRPRIDKQVLGTHAEGIIALSGGVNGPVERKILGNDYEGAKREALELQEIVGAGNFYLELMRTGYEPQDRATDGLLRIHEETGIPVVATNDAHYLKKEDWIAQDIMLCIREGKVLNDQKRFKMGSRELFFKSRAEMAAAFASVPDAVSNTMAIAEQCNVEIEFNVYHLPVFNTGSEKTPEELLVEIVNEGAMKRYGEITTEIRERIDYELGVILKLGFASYFLITADFIEYARSIEIPVGPGRGSAAGSIVAYCTWITDLDPLEHKLIFERFLNAGRVSMPDIDVDFCGNRRDEVIEYCRKKYRPENVSQIITFGTMASRGVLRDVGRVLEIPLGDVDRIAKKVPQGPGASLAKALDEDKELQAIRNESTSIRRLFDLGLQLEGLARHNSIHAAGVVISDQPVADYVPLARSGDDIVTQWQMTELEEVGLLKVDFLGLKTLTILTEAVRLIKEVHDVEIKLAAIPLDDEKTYELMTNGDTLGVFQLESSGMRELLAKLKPDTFEDVTAVLALYRPGPLGSGMVDMFCDRKHGREEVKYPHESTEPILRDTYGVIVYQEQVMRLANVVAGFSMNEADNLRKAMGKKKLDVMLKYKQQFIDGAVELGHTAKWAQELFETIEFFAGYGFNKSHSAAYALLTFQTAYLKAHYPLETLAANLTIESTNSDKVKEFIDEARLGDTKIHPPDINACRGFFDARGTTVFFGLRAVKGVGQKIADAIGDERLANGEYTSMVNFCERHDPTMLNKTALEALCKSGAFDCLGDTRKSAYASLEVVLRSSAQAREDLRRGQGQLFGLPDERSSAQNDDDGSANGSAKKDEWSDAERLACEKAALGFYLSGHPFDKIGRLLSSIAGHDSESVIADESGDTLRIAGMISGLRIMQIRQGRNAGKKMARFQLEDLKGILPVTCFARAYESLGNILADDEIVFLKGRRDTKSDDPALLLEGVERFQSVIRSELDAIVVRLPADRVSGEILDTVSQAVERHHGPQKLLLEIEEDDGVVVIRADGRFGVQITQDLLEELVQVVGANQLSFTRR